MPGARTRAPKLQRGRAVLPRSETPFPRSAPIHRQERRGSSRYNLPNPEKNRLCFPCRGLSSRLHMSQSREAVGGGFAGCSRQLKPGGGAGGSRGAPQPRVTRGRGAVVLQNMPPLSPEKPALCAGCGGKISDRYYLLAVDKQWHLRCLKCCECKLALESELTCFAKDGSIYCKEDYYRYSTQNRSPSQGIPTRNAL